MSARTRPLSPHLGIYRWQLGSTLSILHRFTGLGLAIGLAALSYWLAALAGGEATYAAAMRWFASPVGLALLIGWTFAFFYHLLNGVRHLFWDVGRGFERVQRRVSGVFVVLGSTAATLCLWAWLWHGGRL